LMDHHKSHEIKGSRMPLMHSLGNSNVTLLFVPCCIDSPL
jgi:hypothetical protein